jgi:periplasmic protein CpxP/Spy
MNEHNDTTTATPAKRTGRRWAIALALVAAIGATGAAGVSYAGEGFGMHGHGRHGNMANMDPAAAAKHIDKMIERIAPDATAQQKARLSEIAKSAFADLKPMHTQFRESHKRLHELLMQPTIDRVALEQLRVEQMQRADAVSKRILAAVADAAEVLTPEQRVAFHKHMQKRMHR